MINFIIIGLLMVLILLVLLVWGDLTSSLNSVIETIIDDRTLGIPTPQEMAELSILEDADDEVELLNALSKELAALKEVGDE